MRVIRKRDGAMGIVVRSREVLNPRGSLIPWKTVVDVRLDDEKLRTSAGGDMTGDLSWFRSNFKKVDGTN